jgi:hypothetical protein
MRNFYIPKHHGNKDELLYKLSRRDSEIKDYINYWEKSAYGKKVPSPGIDQIIEQVIPKGIKDFQKKRSKKQYYLGNIAAYKWVYENVFTDEFIKTLTETTDPIKDHDLFFNYSEFLKEFTHDAVRLEQDYQENIKDNKISLIAKSWRPITVWKKTWESDLSIYSKSLQSVFGQVNLHGPDDLQPMNSISNLRLSIELRIRRLFGTYAIYNSDNDSFDPIKVSILIDFIKNNTNDVDFPIQISNLDRIIKWCNIYMHSGQIDYVWNPLLIYYYINPIFCDGCIWIKKEVLKTLKDVVLSGKDTKKYKIYGMKPNIVII